MCSSDLYLVIDENPQEYEVGGSWAHAQARTWAVPDACNLVALQQRVLSPGDWTLYCRPEPVEPGRIPDVFKVPSSETADFAIACGVPLLVQAFHANDPWRLWVEDVSSQREAAA